MALGANGTQAQVLFTAQQAANQNQRPVYVYLKDSRWFYVFEQSSQHGQLKYIIQPG